LLDVVTCGEPMVLFSPATAGPLRHVGFFTKHVAGAELNLSVALARLGLKVGYITRVGDDEFGRYVLACLRAENLDTSLVAADPCRRTGVYFKEYCGLGDPQVYYYRDGSAASAIVPADVKPETVAGTRLVHATGIMPLLSESCFQTTNEMMRIANASGVCVSFDPNVRLRLIARERVPEFMLPFIRQAKIVFANESELEMILGTGEAAAAARELKGAGPELLVVKRGVDGAAVVDLRDGRLVEGPAYKPSRYVDPVGAGDGFDAGFLFGYLAGWHLAHCLRLGNFIGALATTVAGDYEGYPRYAEVEAAGLIPSDAKA